MWIMWRLSPTSDNHSPHQTDNPPKTILKMKKYLLPNEVIEVVESILSLKLKNEVLMTTLIGGFSFGATTGFVSDWIFDPAISFYSLIGLIVCDNITGIVLAFRNDKFETRKALRFLWTMLSHTALLMFATNVSKGSGALIWLNEAVFVPLVIVSMLSLVKNLSLLKMINPIFAEIFYKKIDAYKNDIVKKDEKPVDPVRVPDDGC